MVALAHLADTVLGAFLSLCKLDGIVRAEDLSLGTWTGLGRSCDGPLGLGRITGGGGGGGGGSF